MNRSEAHTQIGLAEYDGASLNQLVEVNKLGATFQRN